MLHTIATLMMLGVGITLLILYFTIKGNKNQFADDKKKNTFDNAMAGILSIGSMLMAFSLAVLAMEMSGGANLGEKAGATWQLYLLFMFLLGIVLVSLASVAMKQLPKAPNSNSKTGLTIIIVVSVIAVIVSGGIGGMELAGKKPLGFGFDFEF